MKFRLIGRGSGKNAGAQNEAGVSEHGEVLVRPFQHSSPTIKKLTDTTITNFLKPVSGERTILTGMYASADRSVNANGDLLEIYESSTDASGTQDKLIFSVDLARQGDAGPNFPTTLLTEGKFLNADRTNATGTITVTIWSYQVPAI